MFIRLFPFTALNLVHTKWTSERTTSLMQENACCDHYFFPGCSFARFEFGGYIYIRAKRVWANVVHSVEKTPTSCGGREEGYQSSYFTGFYNSSHWALQTLHFFHAQQIIWFWAHFSLLTNTMKCYALRNITLTGTQPMAERIMRSFAVLSSSMQCALTRSYSACILKRTCG